MAKRTEAEVRKAIKELRQFIDADNEGMIATRIAYAMECAIRWATEDTVDWLRPVDEARANAAILRKDMELVRGGYAL